MPDRRRSLVGIAAAVALVLAMGTNASAGRLSVSATAFNATWNTLTFRAEGIEVSCYVSVEGSLHTATFSKTRGALLGYVIRGVIPEETCRGTEGTRPTSLDAALPWHLKYNSFSGTLPRITGITLDVVNVSFLLTIFGSSCLYRATSESPARAIANISAEGVVSSIRIDETARIARSSGGIFCPATGTASGSGTLESASGANVTVRLI